MSEDVQPLWVSVSDFGLDGYNSGRLYSYGQQQFGNMGDLVQPL